MASSSSTKKAAKLAQKGKGRKVRFQGGTIERVVIDVSGDADVDHEKEVLAWLARD